MNRIFVEKKAAHNAEARHLLHDLRESLGLPGLQRVRVVQRYDIDGLSAAEFAEAARHILAEPQVDETARTLELGANEQAFAVEYLPGQFDQRADSAAQCIQILTGKERPAVYSAKVIVLEGILTAGEIASLKSYVINAVDSHEVPVAAVCDRRTSSTPPDVAILTDFTTRDPAGIRAGLGLAMSIADVAFCQSYFRDEEKRDPSITEIRMLDTYWSDHCRHTTFLTKIDDVTFDEGTGPVQRAWQTYLATRRHLGREDRPVTLMDIALIGMRELRASGELDNLEVSEEVNAACIVVDVPIHHPPSTIHDPHSEEWLIMFKNETHNHPTEIEPFGGAATCLGGCIRDPLSGRSYVYQAMRVTGAGNPLTPFAETLPGKLPQKKICQIAARGYSSYGNQIGLATGQVAEIYHPGYVAKRLEIGAVVAAAPRSQVLRGTPAPGDAILLIGGGTGRDGIGGATGSSKEHTATALENSAEVQKGDAPTERKIQRLFRNPQLTRKIKVCNDFGAGGVAVAIGEIAPSLDINLDAVPKKYDGLDGTELAISESQERMAVCVDPAEIDYFIREADRENLACVHVANVTDSGRLVMHWRGKIIVNLARAFLATNGVQQTAKIHVNSPVAGASCSRPCQERPAPSLPSHLAALNVCSQKGLGELFDGSVGAGTVLWPFGGSHQLTPPDAMVAKLPLLDGATDACTYMSWGFDPYLSEQSPFHGAVYAVTGAVCKAVAAGARLTDIRLTLQEYFPKPGTDPRRWGMPFAALLGAFHAQHALRLAAIGGKDSMSGSFNELDVPPTLVAFALAPGLAGLALSPEFKQPGSTVSLIEIPRDADNLPDFEALKQVAAHLHQLNTQGAILALHHIGSAGLAAALAKMAFGNRIGFTDGKTGVPPVREDGRPACHSSYFTERYLAFLIEHDPAAADSIRQSLPTATEIGHTTAEPFLTINGGSHTLTDLQAAWTGTLEPVYPTKIEDSGLKIEDSGLKSAERESSTIHDPQSTIHDPQSTIHDPRSTIHNPQSTIHNPQSSIHNPQSTIHNPQSSIHNPQSSISRPQVVIPSFPGTNSEYDSAKAFRAAGAAAEILVFRNLTARHIEESLAALAAAIRRAQILMLPGGFSAGDEPDGSAKFIATIIRSPRVADAIMELLTSRDGLILGICNGFQALIKTGLVPYGVIDAGSTGVPPVLENGRPACFLHDPASRPTLVHNAIGRHVSCYAHTRIVSTLSPWLSNTNRGDIHSVPVSHGEGKFHASPEIIAQLAQAGQIATQYCDANGTPSMDIRVNPNGSLAAIEGITSPCGRVFGKMAHSERAGCHVAKNIPGTKQQPVFAAGVRYFA